MFALLPFCIFPLDIWLWTLFVNTTFNYNVWKYEKALLHKRRHWIKYRKYNDIFVKKIWFYTSQKKKFKKTCLQCDCEQCYYARSQRNGLLEWPKFLYNEWSKTSVMKLDWLHRKVSPKKKQILLFHPYLISFFLIRFSFIRNLYPASKKKYLKLNLNDDYLV